ncbi:TlpA disulfide reductase family protein [Aestuariibaculum sediminum]|uniref:AhpC/TSA family protein n=1 Tax=Aestuariibaculum sediminum TaxID=2770637 RepID=A0A8J6Q9A0_9FLAO|nr:TlpA disulfide reductase family protein [Aestuariibaculum sediminum]MBD0833778.1 AhpC/TSA family protein [Aestuariibaculum sediminum]
MKIIYKLILSICFVITIIACGEKEKKEEMFTISGQVTGFPDGTKFYLRNLATDAVFDSAIVRNNTFKFKGSLASPPEQIWLNTTVDKKFIYTNLLIGNDNITVKGDISDFPWNVNIRGSKTQEDFNYSQSLTKENNIKRDSLVQAFMKLPQERQQEIGAEIWKKIGKIDSVTQVSRINYIKSHPDTYTSVIELGYLKNQLPKDTIQQIFKNYTPEIKESKYAKVVEIYLKENIVNIGDKYHDFEGMNQKGEMVKFSNIRGEYTLLDFTAAYCGPCIQAADELVEINKEYSDSLKIVSFTQDPKKDVWLKSLERDKVAWNSIWDGKGRYSETSIKYGIQGIPTFVLINPEGIIIDKWSGYGKGSIIGRLEKNLSKK